jgi:VWFA-related protein
MPRAFAFLLFALAAAATQQFRSGVELVHLDVSVLDASRRPVTGLTAADFTILEDGQPRPVEAFVAITLPPPPKTADVPWARTVPPDVQVNEPVRAPEGRLFVLLMDDALIPNDAGMVGAARRVGETVIDRLGPGDQMAVVFTGGNRGAQNFTSDPARLHAAVAAFRPGMARHVMGWDLATFNEEKQVWERQVDSDSGYRASSLRTLEDVTTSLAAAPQRRKAVIFVSPGLFADPEAGAGVRMASAGQSMQIHDANASLVARLPPLYRRMRAANITLYTIDPSGLGGMESFTARSAAGLPAIATAKDTAGLLTDWFNPSSPPRAADLARHIARVQVDFLRAAAENTGGLAVLDNDSEGGVSRIFAENGSYYLLGFSPPASHRPGSMHRLEVKVSRPGLTVRTRSGYEAPAVAAPQPSATPSSGSAAAPSPATTMLAGPVAAGTLPMRVALAPFRAPAGSGANATVLVMLGLENKIEFASSQSFDIDVRVFTTEGASRAAERRTGTLTLRPPAAGEAAADLLSTLALPPARYELRIGAHLSPAGLAGGIFTDVDVPDFAKEPVSLSGVLVETSPGGNAGPLEALKDIVSVVPTTRREFTLADKKVSAFLRIYQGGSATPVLVTLRVSLRNQAQELVYNYPHRIAATRFTADREEDFVFDLPLNAVRPGPYLLTFEAVAGTHRATRHVRFVISSSR